MKRVNRVSAGCVACVASLGVLSAAPVWGDGFRNPPPTAEGMGHIGARYLIGEGASSMSYNPADLVEVDKVEVDASATIVSSETKYTAPTGATAKSDDSPAVLPNLYLAWPMTEKVVAGIAFTSPFGQSTEWEKDSVFRYTAPYFAEMRTININPTVAFSVNEQVSIGVGLDVMWSDLDIRQTFPWASLTGDPTDADGSVKLEGDGIGVGGNIGIAWVPKAGHKLAATYVSPIEVDYEGDFEGNGIPPAVKLPPPLAALVSPRSDFESNIEFPAIATLSYGLQVNEKLFVGASVEWLQFSNFDELPLDVANNQPLLPASSLKQDWDDTVTYGLGMDYALSAELVARLGYIYMESPIPDETLAPTLPNNDQHTVTLGLGYTKGAHTFDVAYGYSFFDDRDIDNNQNPAYNGKYETEFSHIVGLSYGFSY